MLFEIGSVIGLFFIVFGTLVLGFSNHKERSHRQHIYENQRKELEVRKKELLNTQQQYEEFMEYYHSMEEPILPNKTPQQLKEIFGKELPQKLPSDTPENAFHTWKEKIEKEGRECIIQH